MVAYSNVIGGRWSPPANAETQGQLGSSSMTGLPVAWSLFSGAIGRLIGVYYHGGFAQEAVVKALKVHEHVRVQAWRGEKVVQPADWSWLDLPGGCTSEIVDDARVYRRAT